MVSDVPWGWTFIGGLGSGVKGFWKEMCVGIILGMGLGVVGN